MRSARATLTPAVGGAPPAGRRPQAAWRRSTPAKAPTRPSTRPPVMKLAVPSVGASTHCPSTHCPGTQHPPVMKLFVPSMGSTTHSHSLPAPPAR